MPERKFDWISRLELGSADDGSIRDEFDSVPDWLTEKKTGCIGSILPWLPVSCADPDVHESAVNLRAQIKNYDETAAVLLSNLNNESEEEELGWPSQVLCSTVLPKFLSLEKSPSRVLMSATIEFCKIHQRAAEYGLVFPLILRKEGINSFICEVVSRVLKECWHLGHISAFCQKLLCGRTEERKFMLLPCHRDLISDGLTWNESLFILFQNILIHEVPLTQGSVSKVQEMAERYCKSLKFGNFLLHFVAKCAPMLHAHKCLLIESVKCTNSLVTIS
ncbi:unnamed protein product [Eruca vesicaria subsp. sativa]|uniref:Uncharacterized protein n=1 Tax=Eruca vesicaria subsp. sativa TaxID=29727 RepID=A0ABC8KYV8_ERUVS|nr:unnamed protein product [Eruca vesicaria subsp. sativa]